eukprot:CAMPEP_0174876790 /NCGR_PEP_ID=MMETSP1114-20130205/80750_1 /TAXON_ID=312471 /ORGANISM="Neobodo designis, Strain CCAP 1951/1" /LENGTH=56 /DNA_ID=CAMNT_0016112161 /DNA_START=148 /DNA_END=315 /DNA_ORIENTATION=+
MRASGARRRGERQVAAARVKLPLLGCKRPLRGLLVVQAVNADRAREERLVHDVLQV